MKDILYSRFKEEGLLSDDEPCEPSLSLTVANLQDAHVCGNRRGLIRLADEMLAFAFSKNETELVLNQAVPSLQDAPPVVLRMNTTNGLERNSSEHTLDELSLGSDDEMASLSEDVRLQLDRYRRGRLFVNELLFIGHNSSVLETGDVFVIQPRKGLYFYGRVLNAGVTTRYRGESGGISWKDVSVICIYSCKTTELTLDSFAPDYNYLLTFPSIVTGSDFRAGYLYKLGNIPISSDEEDQLDYGFYDFDCNTIVDEYGNDLGHRPRLLKAMTLHDKDIGYDVQCRLIAKPSLLGCQEDNLR
jgi:hypothetical protein